MTTLYNRVDEGAFDALRDRHRELDLAVVDAYGWEPEVFGDLRERNRRLHALNGEIVAGARHYDRF